MKMKPPSCSVGEALIKTESNSLSAPPILTHSNSKLKLTLLMRNSSKNKTKMLDINRFGGAGVNFKAKLIGIREVSEASGDRICNEAMQMAKLFVKASGRRKQKVLFNISMESLKIKDNRSAQILYQFETANISFISTDPCDSRAFGFIYRTDEFKFKFYAIKIAQAADIVYSIRDMFHALFEARKEQIEEFEQDENGNEIEKKMDGNVAVADLLNLESELENLEQGMTQLQISEEDWLTSDQPTFWSGSDSLENSNGSNNPSAVSFHASEMFTSSGRSLFDDSNGDQAEQTIHALIGDKEDKITLTPFDPSAAHHNATESFKVPINSLDDVFSRLVDLDSLGKSSDLFNRGPATQPFYAFKNPTRPSMNSLAQSATNPFL